MRESTLARRTNADGKLLLEFHLSAVDVPEILSAHHPGDFSPVMASNPARPGQMLTLKVKANWPTNPPRVPGTLFASDPLHVVPDFIQASVNDLPATVVNRIGWPSGRGVYRVDLLLPQVAPGEAAISLTAGYIPAAEFRLPVR